MKLINVGVDRPHSVNLFFIMNQEAAIMNQEAAIMNGKAAVMNQEAVLILPFTTLHF